MWWTIRHNGKLLRVPTGGGRAEIYQDSKYLPDWEPSNTTYSLEEILEMFLYPDIKVYLENL